MKFNIIILIWLAHVCLIIPSANAEQNSHILLSMPPILAAQILIPPYPPPGEVVSAGGRVWLDRNLGSIRVAEKLGDPYALGDLYQWGRLTDGHEKPTSKTTRTLSTTDVPGHSRFILVEDIPPDDWRTPQNDRLWQGVSGINNPCPSGFRVPTAEEWLTEASSWSSQSAEGAFASPLKLTMTSSRNGRTGQVGKYAGIYWSSTIIHTQGKSLSAYLDIHRPDHIQYEFHSGQHKMGYSVRCIKD